MLLCLLAGLALIGGGAYVVLYTGVFPARDVTVTGAHRVSAGRIREAADVPGGVPLAKLDLGGLGARVAALPGVASVRVVRAWPHTVRLEVTERIPLLAVPQGNRYTLVDDSGTPFATAGTRPKTLPLVILDRISPTDPATRSAVAVLGALPASLRSTMSLLTALSEDAVTLTLRDGRTVVWGSATASRSKARILVALLHRRGSVYDVSAPDIVSITR